MTTQEVANRLVELCREGEWAKCEEELYGENIVGIEPEKSGRPVTEGIAAKIEKSKHWAEDTQEVHSMQISDPVVGGNFFAISMTMDITSKSMGRGEFSEICLYEVDNGKIVRETFHYHIPEGMPQN